MLISLHIENIAVIRKADIDFSTGFTVLTGETGAGKSIIIDSIALLLGARASKELIRSGEERATVVGLFGNISAVNLAYLSSLSVEPDEEGYIMLSRTVSADGKSITKLNGRTIPISLQKQIIAPLINIHGQHENQLLLDSAQHILYLDRYASDGELLSEYREEYRKLSALRHELSSLDRDEREILQLADILNFKISEIKEAKLKIGEEEELTAKRNKLKNIQLLEKNANSIYNYLYSGDKSVCTKIDIALKSLSQIEEYLPQGAELSDRLESCRSEIEDIAESVVSVLDDCDGSSEKTLDNIETRLDLITKLERKYGPTIEDVLSTLKKSEEELSAISGSDEKKAELSKKIDIQYKVVSELAAKLTEIRKHCAVTLGEEICSVLAFLDMEKVRLNVNVSECEMNSDGCDSVEFLISTNAGEELKPLGKVASGGELSRIMLAVKSVLADRENTETLIYDEVDTGISGKTSYKLGVVLKKSAKDGQVLCVTHSPQIASLAQNHYKISKRDVDGRTETVVSLLDYQSRIDEVARIMGSDKITPALLQSAKEMIDGGI